MALSGVIPVRMRKLFGVVLALMLLTVIYFAFFPVGQHADRSFDAKVARPAYTSQHPSVLFDQAHYNVHTLDGGFRPFANLLRNDGYELRANDAPFSAASLAGVNVLVVVNAAGGSNPKLFGFNLVPLRKGKREAPAFTAAEIDAVQKWVAGGGSLLLVADHYPFGSAASSLAKAFGVTMHCGYAEVDEAYRPKEDSGAIEFSRANGLLGETRILDGVDRVLSFTGQSLDAPNGIELLKLPPTAVEYVPPPPNFTKQPAGRAQAVAIEYGKGRVIVLGEAAMLTAQVEKGYKFGMNVPGTGNRQFVLGVMHWLSRA